MNSTRFTIDIPDAEVAELDRRLAQTRWPGAFDAAPWDYGVPQSVMREVVRFWRRDFDWRTAERALNRWPQYRARVGGLLIHYLHVKGTGPRSRPLILTHGWPGSFAEMLEVVGLLTDPAAHGLGPLPSFDVVVPSLPGFGFSEAPASPGVGSAAIARLWHELMDGLGYPRYFAQGGDIGAGVSCWLARLFPGALLGLHLNYIPGGMQPSLGPADRPVSEAESAWLARRQDWAAREGGYSHQQGTRPETLGYALTDSPVGLAAWILEKFHAWSDGQDRPLEDRFDMNELLANVCLYWFGGNASSSLRIYRENSRHPLAFGAGERIGVPLSFASFPREIMTPPRKWVERAFDVARWTEMPAGGHFAALEQPRALAMDIHASFATPS